MRQADIQTADQFKPEGAPPSWWDGDEDATASGLAMARAMGAKV